MLKCCKWAAYKIILHRFFNSFCAIPKKALPLSALLHSNG